MSGCGCETELNDLSHKQILCKWLFSILKCNGGGSTAQCIWYGMAGVVIVADQITKFLAAHMLTLGEQVRITPFFNLVHARNSGAAFGFLADANGWQRYFFIVIALSVSTYLMKLLTQNKTRTEAIGYSMILGGALGNTIDRILHGAVVDFLDIYWNSFHWPAFNLADTAICLGVTLILFGNTYPTGKSAFSS
ncbi:MAG TPA: signal peptidase II [Gammaproteobacteria bacterium]